MKIKEVRVDKQFKIGLPNFSNLTCTCGLTAEVGENEEVDWNKLWDKINHELFMQEGSIDPNWIVTKDYKNFFKTTIRHKKEESE